MPITQFPASFSVSSLNGKNGFVFTGVNSLRTVNEIGDLNDDGRNDIILCSSINTPGACYVVFTQDGIGSSGTLDLTTLDGNNGFSILGVSTNNNLGYSVSGLGDINGDEIDDLIIGAPGVAGNPGMSYVIFGRASIGSSGTFSLHSLNGAYGFSITGSNLYFGESVNSAGDINADGINDLIIGDTSASYVIFGASGLGSSGVFSLNLDGSNGFIITGADGQPCGNIDINGDGMTDLFVGVLSPTPPIFYQSVYIILGSSGIGSSGSLSLSSLNSGNSFVITCSYGGNFGYSISNVGDVNADGISDIIIGNPNYSYTYVVFGKVGIAGLVDVANLNGVNGFAIPGLGQMGSGTDSGWSTSSAGDINFDNIADLVIGAPFSSPNGQSNAGNSYVVFGKKGIGAGGMLPISDLDGSNGFAVNAVVAGEFNSWAVSNAGDINADGVDDFVSGSNAQDSYVVFGEKPANITVNSSLTVHEGQTLILSSHYLNATNPQNPSLDSTLFFTVSNIQHGRFFNSYNASLALNSFLQQEVQMGQILFSHDGSGWAPTYNVSVSYPKLLRATLPQPTTIEFQQSFALVNNKLTINQGQTIILTTTNLLASDLYNSGNDPNLIFVVSNVQHGYFAFLSRPTIPIASFSQAQLQSGSVHFVTDNSLFAPSFEITVINGAVSTLPQACSVIFNPPVLVDNYLSVNQGQTVILTSSNLSATDPVDSGTNLVFIISNIMHGYFSLNSNPTIAITNFTQSQVQNAEVQFVHDGSIHAPTYSVSLSDGNTILSPQAATISFDASPILVNNNLIVNQGQITILTSANLNATDPDNYPTSLTFLISDILYGYFALLINPSTPIMSFSQSQIQSHGVQFVTDGSTNTPSYSVAVSDGRMSTTPQIGLVVFSKAPILLKNSLTVNQGQAVVLSSSNFDAIDPNNGLTTNLTYTISNIQHGFFALSTNPTQHITSFTQQQIQNGDVQFVPDGSIYAPSFSVAVSNNKMTISAKACRITFNTAPVLTHNHLIISQGQTITLTSAYLSAIDSEIAVGNLLFIASGVTHGHFEESRNPGISISSFAQQKVMNGAMQFVSDGSVYPPSYNISVNDGSMVITPSKAIVDFSLATPAAALTNSNTVQNAIIGGAVSGGLGLIFLFLKIYLTQRATKNLYKLLNQDASDTEKKHTAFYKDVVLPIATKVFDRIDTTGFLGYRSEKETKAYMAAIEYLVGKLIGLGINLDLRHMSHEKQNRLLSEIARQTKKVVGKTYHCCTLDYLYSFFKPEVTPVILEDKAATIAASIKQALLPSSPISITASSSSDIKSPPSTKSDEERSFQLPNATKPLREEGIEMLEIHQRSDATHSP